jgi:hypothetical protein
MRNRKTRYAALMLGMLVAVSIVFSQYAQLSQQKEKHKTEQSADQSNDAGTEKVIPSLTSLPSHTVINFSHEVFCLFEIVFGGEQTSRQDPLVLFPVNKFFSTLLSVIISPNAP